MISTRKRHLIYLVAYLAYSSIYIARVNLTMANPALVATSILTTEQIGMLGGVFSATFAVGRLLNGVISDKAPPFAMVCGGLALAAASNITIGFFPPFIGIFLLWMTNAYAQSMLWGSLLSVMSAIYDAATAKKRTAFLSTSVAVGNIAGILLCTWLITAFGVRYAFILPGILTLLLGFFVFFSMRTVRPAGSEKKHLSIWQLLWKREVRRICIPAAIHGVMKENISLWMTVYIIDTYAVDLSASAYYLMLIPAFGFVGRTVHQIFYRMFSENEHRVSMLGFVLTVLFSAMLCVGKVSALYGVLCLTAIYAAISMVNTSFLSIYPIRFRDEGNVSSVSGVIDFVTYLGAGISAFAYGYIIKPFGYETMFITWAVLAALACIFLIPFLKENKQ